MKQRMMRMRNVCQWRYLELDDEKEIDDIENIYDAANITAQDNLNDSMIENSKGDLWSNGNRIIYYQMK